MKYISTYLGHRMWLMIIIIVLAGCDHHCNNNDEISKVALYQVLEFYGMVDDSDSWQLDRTVEQDYALNFGENRDYSGGHYYFTKTISDTNSWLAFEFYYSENDTILIPTELYH